MKTSKKSRTRRRAKRTSKSPPLPDLRLIVKAFHDAYALVWTANEVIAASNYYGPEQVVLHQGVEAIKQVCERLEAAHQIARFGKAAKELRGVCHDR